MNDLPEIHDKTADPVGEVESTIDQFQSEYFGNLVKYKESSDMQSEIREKFDGDLFDASDAKRQRSDRMVKLAILASVTSIRTNTQKWENLMREYLKGEISESGFAEKCMDGNVKSEKIEYVFNSDIPRQVRRALWLGKPDMARQVLIGLETGDVDETYMRATKSAFVTYLLGYNTFCMDHRNHRALKPVIQSVMTVSSCKPQTENGDIQQNANRKARSPTNVDFWHDSLKWHVDEYDSLIHPVIDYVDEHTDIPRDRIPQVTFNVGGNGRTTIHEDLLKILSA